MDFTLPMGEKGGRVYLLKDAHGKELLNGNLTALRTLFKVPKGKATVVKGFCHKVSMWAVKNSCTFTIDGKTYDEAYPKEA